MFERAEKRYRRGEIRKANLAAAWITVCLALASVLGVGFYLALALAPGDVGVLESPLIMVVARQLRAGPWGLYGPFGGRNPLVLIHAPLYYRLAALLARPITACGLDRVAAAMIAGRSLAILSLGATAVASDRLAREGGMPGRTGWWAALLILSSPVIGATGFSVRPDMMAVALQTTGVVLLLSWLKSPGDGVAKLTWAFALFGLAVCTKQQCAMAAVISLGLLLAAWRQGRAPAKAVVHAVLLAAATITTVFCVEDLVSEGRMRSTIFVAAANVSRVHPAGWLHVATVLAAVIGNSVGLIALLGASALGALHRTGGGLGALRIAGGLLVGLAAVLSIFQVLVVRLWIWWLVLAASLAILLLVLAAAARPVLFGRRPGQRIELDATIAVYIAGELLLVIVLCRLSEGAWVNYAIGAMVFTAVITARAASRLIDQLPGACAALLLGMAAIAAPGATCMDLKAESSRRRAERAALVQLLVQVGRPASEFFFADRPGYNRQSGRLELVYDDWLYPVFESIGLAENRARWLRRALAEGPVTVVVTTSELQNVAGIELSRATGGYQRTRQIGPFVAYERASRPAHAPPGYERR
jgi:hypothetical protein